jgi:L-ribulokinase
VGRFQRLESQAAALEPGQSGLLALDWLNGNRSILDDSELSGLFVGVTLSTTAADVYRAVMESCAFGTRVIIDRYRDHGVAVREIVACGGLAHGSGLFLQIVADVCNRPIRVAASRQTSALGAALYGAVAAGRERGGAATIVEAADRAAHLEERQWKPVDRNARVYSRLYDEYRELYTHFGQESAVMRRLRRIRDRSRTGE